MNLLDTNSVAQIGQTAQAIKIQLNPWLPAIAIAAAWLGRELNRLAAWSAIAGEKIIAHGGLLMITKKILWNPTPSVVPLCGTKEELALHSGTTRDGGSTPKTS